MLLQRNHHKASKPFVKNDDDDNNDEESTIHLNEIISQIPPSIAITPELDEFIKSSVEDLVPILSESEDYVRYDDESLPKEDVLKENFKIYSNPLFEFDDEYISSDLGFSSHTSFQSNKDECFDSGGDFILEKIKACFTSDSILPRIDDDDFDLEGDILLLEKLLNNDPSSPLPSKELNFKELKEIKSDVSTDFEDDYYDSEGDLIYLE
ncbi:hypothetical protein Tco_0359941 [Tanacetum coccineum]